jgi:hypothetical protein
MMLPKISGANINTLSLKKQPYNALTTRKGNSRIADMSLNTRSIDRPMILNGKRSSQINGNRMIRTRAIGQQRTNRMHQRITAMSVFIVSDDGNSLSRT